MGEPESESESEGSVAVTLEKLGQGECLQLLATRSVARIGLVVDGRPMVLPVNYALDGRTIVFRTAEGTVLNQAVLQEVAVEVDQIDESTYTGWSVLVQGVAQDVSEAVDTKSERLRALSLVTWAPGQRHRWFGVTADSITGRRLRVGSDRGAT